MAVIPLFTSGVYRKSLSIPSKKKFNRDLVEECFKLQTMDVDGQKWSTQNYLGGYTSYSSYSNLHHWSSTFEFLQNQITPHVYQFLDQLGYDTKGKRLSMSTFWVNIMGTATTHSWHIHPRSVVSGTYYVQIPKDSIGIKFEDPRMNFMMAALPKKKRVRQDQENFVHLRPKEGDVVLFESWMRHEVPPNPSGRERISVSFNYEWFD